jgi:inner membrane protein
LDPITQGTLGAALPQAFADRDRIRWYAGLGFLSGLAPDLDILISSSTDPLLYLEYHRQFSHSLIFIPVGAALCALVGWLFVRNALSWRETYLACLLGYATHGLLDACTSFGTQMFWPFSTVRIAWNSVSVIDPLFTLPLMTLVLLAMVRRQRLFAVIGLVWACVYLLIGVLQHERALDGVRTLAEVRGHDARRVTVKPGFANLLLWKSIYEADGRYYVDGVRVGVSTEICPGQHAEKLSLERDLPWLDPASQQYRDLERFRWYSDDYLALDHTEPLYIVDVRYSSLPNRIDALWGLQLDDRARPGQHATYRVVSSRRTEALGQLGALLRGVDCTALRFD